MAPANIGGRRLSQNLRPGPYNKGDLTTLAFWTKVNKPMAKARMASPIHAANHSFFDGSQVVRNEVKSALIPIRMPPQPGTAVKALAFSIVSRMKRRLSYAC